MKKKLVGILLTAVMCTASLAMTALAEDSDKIQVAFVPQLIGIPYFTAMDEGGQQAAEDLGCEWIYTGDTTASADLQVTQIDSLIRRGVDAISLSVLDSSSTNPSIKKAQEAGIIAFTSDSDAADSTRSFYVAQADDIALGETLMEELAQEIGGEGKVGIVSGVATATNLNTWIKAMQDYAAANYPDIEILDIKYTANGSSEEALQQAQDLPDSQSGSERSCWRSFLYYPGRMPGGRSGRPCRRSKSDWFRFTGNSS